MPLLYIQDLTIQITQKAQKGVLTSMNVYLPTRGSECFVFEINNNEYCYFHTQPVPPISPLLTPINPCPSSDLLPTL